MLASYRALAALRRKLPELTDPDLKRLHWRAHHRGTKEADLMIGGFFDAHNGSWGAAERALFADMLEEQDVDIMAWALGTREAPERFQGGPLSERTEIFAIGVTLYEALTRTYPYGEIERFQTPRFDTVPKRLTKLNSAIPHWLESVILRSLSPHARDRYQNFSEMAYDLSHPDHVNAFYRKDAPLLERNPLLFYKLLAAALFLSNLLLLAKLSFQK